jgi:hypothetical protein
MPLLKNSLRSIRLYNQLFNQNQASGYFTGSWSEQLTYFTEPFGAFISRVILVVFSK